MVESGLSSPLGQPVIRVPERGYADVPRPLWTRLAGDAAFWRLVEAGILSISHPSQLGIRLHGSCHVGRAVLGGMTVELHEKVPGALRSLLGHTTHDAFRVERLAAPTSELGVLAALLVRQFLSAVSTYVSLGREFVYSTELRTGSLVGGRIDITRSLRLRARGLGHRLAFEKNVISFATKLNLTILAALREIENIAALVDIPASDLAESRALSMLFADCRTTEILFGRRADLARTAQAVAEDPSTPLPHRDIAALAGTILAHESFEAASSISQRSAPRAWFLNLETLFETAVLNILARLSHGMLTVTHGRKRPERVFESDPREFRANPDLVLRDAGITVAVGDVKYKTWTGTAIAGDIYQLLVHASAFRTTTAFLVFPSDCFLERRLGAAVTGATTSLFSVDVRDLSSGLSAVLNALGLVPSPAI